jgi:putative SOS response-associated peptidase YedK
MCGRYAFFDEEEVYEARKILEDIAETFGKEKAESVKTGEVFPSETAAAILQTASGKPVADAVKWGYTLSGQKSLIINAKSETLFEKPLFLTSLAYGKCLIPANGFFEWKGEGDKKKKYSISLKDRRMFYFCGLYADFNINGNAEKRFVIITQNASPSMLRIHNRMPLIPPKDLEQSWLTEARDVQKLLEEITRKKPFIDIKAV